MGNINTEKTQSKNNHSTQAFLSKIQKVSSEYSQKWGNYSIYQQQQKPYDYFLEYIHISLAERDFLEKKLIFYQNMPKHRNLVPVEYAEIIKRKQMCAQFDVLRIFSMYYNFTLEDAIKVKIKQKNSFTEGQLVYILRSLLLIGKYFETQLKAKCYSGIFQCKEIFISPEGHLKIYPFNDNIFGSFVEIFDKKQKDQEGQKSKDTQKRVQSKKQVTELDKKGLKRGEQRKGGLRTTLKDQSLREVNSVKQLNDLKEKQFESSFNLKQNLTKNQSESEYMSRYSEESVDMDKRKGYQCKIMENSNDKDWFELGLLMMQLILLNDSHQYYLQKHSNNASQKINENSLGLGFNKQKINNYNKQQLNNNNNIPIYLSAYQKNASSSQSFQNLHNQQYLNQQGKVPNFDLIYFSLKNVLPKKNISLTLIQIITLLLSHQNSNLNYQQLINKVQQHQETLSEPKYCLKFDVYKNDQTFTPESSDKHVSRYMVKNQSLDPLLKTTNLSSNAYLNNDSSFHSHMNENKPLSQSKESFFARNLDDFISANNLTKSMIVEEQDNNNSIIILDNLKKSRKLVPSKIRSISTKNTDPPSIKTKRESQNIQFNFG